MKKNVLTTIFVSFITAILTGTITVFAANGLLSSEVAYNDDNTQLGQTNVQGAIEKLYTDANNYSRINGYFVGNPTSTFHKTSDGDGLAIGESNTSGNTYIDLYYNGKIRGNFVYGPSANKTILSAWDSNGTSGAGTLSLNGSPVQINGTNISDIVKYKSQTATIGLAYASHVQITAPSYSGYTFLTWYHCSTNGWIGTVYLEYPGNATTNIWNATYGRNDASTTTGTAVCYALYIKS